MQPLEDLVYSLTEAEVLELQHAVDTALNSGKPARDLIKEDFPLPTLTEHVHLWQQQLIQGLGFQVIRGVPVANWSLQQAEIFFWCFGLHFGRPGEQNPEGHLLGHVTDLGVQATDATARLYKTAANIEYHCDAADVVGLLCLKKAKSGGHSRIVSSISVFNALIAQQPELAARLFEPVQLDIRDKGIDEAGSSVAVQPCCYAGGTLRTFYHADYFRSVTRHADVAPLTHLERSLFDTYERIANDPAFYLDMDLKPGDIQLLSNHSNLHARTEYEDFPVAAEKRHLLRLWISL